MDDWVKAGKIAAEVLDYGKKLIKIDESILKITEKIESRIKSLGGEPAFPINISTNYIAAHYTASKEDKNRFKEGDLVKLDVGVHVNGAIGDNAVTIDLGKNKLLVDASKSALNEAVKIVKEGLEVREIGKVIQTKIQEHGFSPVINLSGHRMDIFNVHAGLTIPNYDNGDKTRLEKDMIIAIEPFATNGEGKVIEGKGSDIFKLLKKKPVRNEHARKILKIIEKYQGLPFAKRWIDSSMKDLAFNILEREKIIHQYPQLIESSRGLVSQAEHTVMVGKGILTKKE
ncbi:MAG: type II methionyl aminopeptidase [Candidatus Nanoarchaeia archaeon]|jgi:methionyl aminopeptidase|nr:type II methionyl aminopeptidase [Candidatus Nanoarchaeia archaeon]|tara:strand:+ start:30705 stop:31562 length:858 start_codon:yes stop_codon:yes gene_type:complete